MAVSLELFRGLPFEYLVTMNDADSNPIDLTGATILMKIRLTVETEDVLAELSTTNGRITINDPTAGKFTLFLDDTVTTTISQNSVFDIKVTLQDNTVYLVAQGGKIKSRQFVSR